MTYTKGTGAVTSNPTESSAEVEFIGDFHYAVNFFIHNLGVSDTIELRVYFWDSVNSAYRLYSSDPYNGNSSIKCLHFAFTFAEKIKFTFQRTAGVNQIINYAWVKSDP
jgi:hypothetical protein